MSDVLVKFREGVLRGCSLAAVTGYRLQTEVRGALVIYPEAIPLLMRPFQVPQSLTSGKYQVLYYSGDAAKQTLIQLADSVIVEWSNGARDQVVSVDGAAKEKASEPLTFARTFEAENDAYRLAKEATSARFYDSTIRLFEGFHQTMAKSAVAYEELIAKSAERMAKSSLGYELIMSNNLEMIERYKAKTLASLEPPPPPPPPQWEKVITVGAPALRDMFVSAVRAMSGNKTPLAEPSVADLTNGPISEQSRELYEILGTLSNRENMAALIDSDEAFNQWSETVKAMVGGKAAGKKTSGNETN